MSEPQSNPMPRPHNLEAEQALLGALLLQNDVYGRVADILKPEHFYEPLHGAIYDSASKLIIAGKLCTPHLLAPVMPVQDLGEGMTVKEYLARLAASATTVSGAPAYAQAIVELALRRSIIALADDTTRRAIDMPADTTPNALIEDVTRSLADLGSTVSVKRTEPESISVAAAEAVRKANEIRTGQLKLDIIHTGISSLDKRMGGITRGNHIVIAGRPGSGKTALAVQIALNIARRHPVLYFSLEMSNEEISHRAMSSLAFDGFDGIQLPYQILRDPSQMDDQQMGRMVEAERNLRQRGLISDPSSGLSIEQISMRAKMQAARLALQGKKLGGVVIDHLGLVKAPKNIQSRVHQIEHITNEAKNLAKAVDAPVFSLAQLSRAVELRDDKRPQLSDLRDSGAIEQDADFVIGVYREDYYVQKSMWKARHENDIAAGPNEMEAILLKNRHGGEGKALLWCDMPHNVIGDAQR